MRPTAWANHCTTCWRVRGKRAAGAAGVSAPASVWKDDATAQLTLLVKHQAALGLEEASPRMCDARLGAELVASQMSAMICCWSTRWQEEPNW